MLHGIIHTPRPMVFGGFPAMGQGRLIGAIGLNGDHYSQNLECGRAALKAINAADGA